MSSLSKAGEAVQHLAKQYAAVIEVGKHLEKLGALENLEAELNASIEAARNAEAEAIAKKEQAEKAFADSVAAHEAGIKAVQEQGDRLQREAAERAGSVVAAAEAEVARIHAEAEARQAAFVRDHEQAEAKLKRLEDQVAERVAELVRVNNALNELRAKFT